MRFPLSLDAWRRLPRHPDWRYELLGGVAYLTPRPRPLLLRRPTALPVPQTRVDAEVRELDVACDRAAVAALLLDAWSVEDPYRSLDAPGEVLSREIDQSLDAVELGAVAVDDGAVQAVALIHGRSGAPMLNWLTVARGARERGLATAMLRFITGELLARGVGELASGVSVANVASLRWHLKNGFELAPDPVREALRSRSPDGSGLGSARHRPAQPTGTATASSGGRVGVTLQRDGGARGDTGRR